MILLCNANTARGDFSHTHNMLLLQWRAIYIYFFVSCFGKCVPVSAPRKFYNEEKLQTLTRMVSRFHHTHTYARTAALAGSLSIKSTIACIVKSCCTTYFAFTLCAHPLLFLFSLTVQVCAFFRYIFWCLSNKIILWLHSRCRISYALWWFASFRVENFYAIQLDSGCAPQRQSHRHKHQLSRTEKPSDQKVSEARYKQQCQWKDRHWVWMSVRDVRFKSQE